jgi:hypothetical protein
MDTDPKQWLQDMGQAKIATEIGRVVEHTGADYEQESDPDFLKEMLVLGEATKVVMGCEVIFYTVLHSSSHEKEWPARK